MPCAVAKVMINPYQEAVEEDWNHGIFEISIGHSEGASHRLIDIGHHEGRPSLFCNPSVSQSSHSSIRHSMRRSTKTQVIPSSALNRTKHHQSNPSNIPGILYSTLPKRGCIYASKSLITRSNRIPSLQLDPVLQPDYSLPVLLLHWLT